MIDNVLHIWSQSATANVIARWQRLAGYQAHVIVQSKHDPMKVAHTYGDEIIGGKMRFVLVALKRCKNYDLIHLHDSWFMIPLIKIRYPKKKIIMHYHGSMIRNKMKESRRKIWERLVDKILVSTPDLLEFEYRTPPIYVPNPVDTILFKPNLRIQNGKCFIALKKHQSKYYTERLLRENGIRVDLETRPRVHYQDFPSVLKEFEYVCDIPIVNYSIIKANSTVGLQSMSMGIKTISWDYTIKDSLPENHNPVFTVELLRKIYNEL